MELLSSAHIAAIIGTALAALLFATLARRLAAAQTRTLARALAVLILVGFVVEQTTYAARGDWSVRLNLPLNLSDVVTFVAVAALWHPRRGVLTELAWFWGLTATLQAVLTPDLGYTFPDLLYITFFVTHGGAIVAAFMLVIGLRLVPRRWAVIRVYGLTIACAAVAAVGCVITGGNYMYLRRKPSGGSILDALGPWPWYLLAAALLGLAMLLVLEALTRGIARIQESRPAGARAPAAGSSQPMD
jgi:hypothetical integral membrane protein (TIGR02206 family)